MFKTKNSNGVVGDLRYSSDARIAQVYLELFLNSDEPKAQGNNCNFLLFSQADMFHDFIFYKSLSIK